MSTKYKALTTDDPYFMTLTSVGWVDIFTRVAQKQVITDALKYCQVHKGLEIYAYCLMPSHLHLLAKATQDIPMSAIIRDFKKHTSKQIIKTIVAQPESRREWLLAHFSKACEHLKQAQNYKVWKNGYHAEIIYSNSFLKEKLNYIHNNPVQDKIVQYPEDYLYSSARNYALLSSEIEVICLPESLM